MYAALFVFTLVTAHVTAEIPSYIHPCGSTDPNYAECILNNTNNVKDKICIGIPELNIPPKEPLIFDKLVIFDTASTKLHLRNTKIYGFCDFVVNSVHADAESLHFDFNITVNHLKAITTYDFDVRILMQTFAHKGLVHLTSDNIDVKLRIHLKTIIKGGRKHAYVSKTNLNFDIKEFDYKFDENEKDLVDLHKIIDNIVTTNEDEIIGKIKPSLEKEVSKQMISVFNDVLQHTSYEELFPENT